MPLAFDKNTVLEFSRPEDADLPEDRRPVFLSRALTARQSLQAQQLVRESFGTGIIADQLSLIGRSLAIGLTGWRNVTDADGRPVEFSLKDGAVVGLDSVYTIHELKRFAFNYPDYLSSAEVDLKKASASSSASSSAGFAKDAAPTASGRDLSCNAQSAAATAAGTATTA